MRSAWLGELFRRSAGLAAAWQGVGFTHGVLNTDNLSVLGLTLDYGPFGFMDRCVLGQVVHVTKPPGQACLGFRTRAALRLPGW